MAKKRSRRRNHRRLSLRSLRPALPRLSELEQSQLDAIGLGLVAAGVFFSFVFYFGWDGGRVGGVLADAFAVVLGRVAYLVPFALLAAGAGIMLHSFLPRVAPFKVGGTLLLVALTLGYAAGSFGLGPDRPARDGSFDLEYLMDHGGLLGECLYLASSTLFQRVGSHIAFAFLFLSGMLLLTGASVAGILRGTGGAVSGAATSIRARAGELAGLVTGEIARARADAHVNRSGLNEEPEEEPRILALHEQEMLASPERAQATEEWSESPTGEVVAPVPDASAGKPPEARARPADDPGLTPQGNRRSAVTESEQIRYSMPDPALLRRSSARQAPDTSNQERVAKLLVETLGHFGIEAEVLGKVTGPRVTRHELSLAPGTKVSKVAQLKDDLAYALATTDIRVLAPIPGKQAVGVEVPNQRHRLVHLGDIFRREIVNGSAAKTGAAASALAVWLGKDIAGNSVWTDLARMPHLLVAGTTGSGKSGCVNAMLSSILLRASPNEVRMVLVDPKRVELNYYDDVPHLLTPVVTVPRMAANVLHNLIREMESRYEVMGQARSRNIVELNRARTAAGEPPLPYILCVIDELADLMMVASAEVEDAIIRLAQKSRAVGIHLVLATQRPSVDVITGTIKVNVPARISFAVSSQHDSRVILDQGGAEALLGQGDMLFRPVGSSKLQRIQGAYVSEEEIAKLTEQWRAQGEPVYEQEFLDGPERDESEDELSPDEDDLLREAVTIVAQTQTASVSMLQRRLRVGYTRAGRLIDMLERRGVISGYEGSKPRQVLITEADIERMLVGSAESQGEPAVAALTGPAVGPDAAEE
jgi:DNA segregation ATPase FtsK/SpoIIIE, S-DNA-T family